MLYAQHPLSEIPAGFLTASSPLPYARHIFGTRENTHADSTATLHGLMERFGQMAWMQQVHGARVMAVEQPGNVPECDAIITSNPNLWLAVKTADCVPILISSAYAVAAVHAGWRSAEAGILPNTIAALCRNFNLAPEDLHLAFGPCLSQPNFEVEATFIDKFQGQFGVRDAARFFAPAPTAPKVLMDLPGLLAAQAKAAGCLDIHVHQVKRCTYAEPAVFNSYRRHTHAQQRGEPSSYAVQVSLIRRLPPG
jgi:YfiH family protein